MYGYTPPTVIAVDPDLLADAGGFQRVAAAFAAELKRRPAWVVVKAADAVWEADDSMMALEACLRSPADVPADLDDGAAWVLQTYLRDEGSIVPLADMPSAATPHSPSSAIVPGTWVDAANLAQMAGASRVEAWTLEPGWVPDEVAGVPFVAQIPGARLAAS